MDLNEIWIRLKKLYSQATINIWNRELTKLLAYTQGRKPGQDPYIWIRQMIIIGKNIENNLRTIIMDILISHILVIGIGDDLQNIPT